MDPTPIATAALSKQSKEATTDASARASAAGGGGVASGGASGDVSGDVSGISTPAARKASMTFGGGGKSGLLARMLGQSTKSNASNVTSPLQAATPTGRPQPTLSTHPVNSPY